MRLMVRRFALLLVALAYSSVAFMGMGVNPFSVSVVSQQVQAEAPQAIDAFNAGMKAFEKGQYNAAITAFEQAVRIDPSYGDAWYNLGSVNFRVKQYEPARFAFQKAVWRNPKDPESRYNLAWSLENLGKTKEAYDAYSQVPYGSAVYGQAQQKMAQLAKLMQTSTNATTIATSKPATWLTGIGKRQLVVSSGLGGPTGIATGAAGELYVANYSKNSIVKILPNGKQQVVAQSGLLAGPIGLVRDPRNGHLYVANYLKNNLIRITPEGRMSLLATGFGKPYMLYFDVLTHTLFVSEQETNTVSKVVL
jgi:tetratricopeptide (TPR) repeat protein